MTRIPIYVVSLVFATAVSGVISGYALSVAERHVRRTATLLAIVMASTALWSLSSAITHVTRDPATTLTWHAIANVATFVLPVAWLLFSLQYAGYERFVTRKTAVGLSIVPGITLVALVTNLRYGWFYEDVEILGDGAYVAQETGWAYDAHLLYAYVLITLGIALLLHFAYASPDLYRGQAIAIVVGAGVPLCANVLYQVGFGTEYVNLTPITFALSGIAFGFAVFRYQLLEVVPIARETVVETMRDGVVVLDGTDRIVDANTAAVSLLGVAGDPVGKRTDEVRVGERSLASVVDDPGDELEVDRGDERRYVTVRSTPLSDGSGGRLVLLQDITDRRRTEERFQRLIENSSDVVTVLEADGTVQYQSPSILRVLGYRPEEMSGENAFDYVHPDDREAVVEQFGRATTGAEATIRIEFRMRHADGSWRILDAAGRNLFDDPVVDGIVVNSRDVTNRRRHERELERTNERLDEFASVVSHDLRNPLNVADGYLELVGERVDDDAIDVVREQHERMREIIEDALTLAREGAIVDATDRVDLELAARIAWGNVDTKAATLEVAGGLTIEADRNRLVRALENLFRNAIDHAGTDVRVEVGPLESATGFYVADDGPGIPPEKRERVFESGFTSSAEGTGFGLAIVTQIAAAHGWSVRAVDGAPGARFEFLIDEAVDGVGRGDVGESGAARP